MVNIVVLLLLILTFYNELTRNAIFYELFYQVTSVTLKY